MFLKIYHSKVFRYFIAAGIATVVDIIVYFVMYNYVLQKRLVPAFGFNFTAPTVSLATSYSCGLITNFLITKFFVFHESTMRTRWQFVRFASVAFMILGLNSLLSMQVLSKKIWVSGGSGFPKEQQNIIPMHTS